MKAIKPLLLSLSMFALAGGAAQAADEKKSDTQAKPSMSQSGSASSGATGSSGSSKSPSASGGASGSGDAAARYDFDKADKNKDGQLSRQEFNDMMKASASAGGSTSGAGQTSAGQTSGSTSAKTQTPSSGKMDDKPKTK
jgi:EF hand